MGTVLNVVSRPVLFGGFVIPLAEKRIESFKNKRLVGSTTLAAAFCFDVPASHAFGDAPWCAVKNIGRGDYWDCQYRTFEACYPNALADRGSCYLNPWPGPATPSTAAYPRHLKRYARQH
jgi:Protein of unknown function (DUF3551)